MDINDGVTVKLLFFAQSKDLAGVRETQIILPRKISYRQLLNYITETYNLIDIKNNILIAKNEEVCDENVDLEICDKDHIAVIPPLSGG